MKVGASLVPVGHVIMSDREIPTAALRKSWYKELAFAMPPPCYSTIRASQRTTRRRQIDTHCGFREEPP